MQIPKAIAFDLDGTLSISKTTMTPEMGRLLSELTNLLPIALLSGAGFFQMKKQFLTNIPGDANFENIYLFPANAAQCYTYKNREWQAMYDHSLTEEEKETVIAAIQQALHEVGLTEEPAQLWGERIEDRGAQISFSPLGQQAPVEEKEMWRASYQDKRHRMTTLLIAALPDFAVAMGGITTIDITRKGTTKAFGLEQLSKLTEIAIADMLYVGDALWEGGNDAIVIPTGVQTHQVSNPDETATLITGIIDQF